MVSQYSLESIRDNSPEFVEIKKTFYSLPDNDPYKDELYKNIMNMYQFIDENNQDNKPKIRLLNNLESGKIELSQLGYTSTRIQEIYSGAYSLEVGVTSNRGKMAELVKKQSNIIASLKAGSFIIEIDSIGNKEKNGEIDLIENGVDKFDLVNKIMQSISSIKSEDEVSTYLRKFGYKSLVSTQKWFKELVSDGTEFEYINKKNDIERKFDKVKIVEIYNTISEMKEIENTSKFTIKGILIGVINDSKKVFFKDINDEKISVEVLDESLEHTKITTNRYHELEVKKIEKSTLEKENVKYEIDTVYGTSLRD